MKGAFNAEGSSFAPTIEELASDYGLPTLARLYKEKARNVTLVEMKLSAEVLLLRDQHCRLEFTYDENFKLPNVNWPFKGFRLGLIDQMTNEALLSAVHLENPEDESSFSINTGIKPLDYPHLAHVSPASIMQALTTSISSSVQPILATPVCELN